MYVTRQDYLDFEGINLEIELYDDDKSSGKVERFIEQVEDFVIDYLTLHYTFNQNMLEVTPFMDKFKKGIMCQMRHILKYGWDGMIDEQARNHFRSCGFCNIRRGGSYER